MGTSRSISKRRDGTAMGHTSPWDECFKMNKRWILRGQARSHRDRAAR
ncbi:hypothetical protein PSN_2048 [Pseudomonas sp. NGC7]